mmetsp:Transcript_8089/g.19352  ORF Transcript_8089/g.19352 Transcript_8089/m.19352 type:complete len:204 (-) Transcript_8089:238-849(-)
MEQAPGLGDTASVTARRVVGQLAVAEEHGPSLVDEDGAAAGRRRPPAESEPLDAKGSAAADPEGALPAAFTGERAPCPAGRAADQPRLLAGDHREVAALLGIRAGGSRAQGGRLGGGRVELLARGLALGRAHRRPDVIPCFDVHTHDDVAGPDEDSLVEAVYGGDVSTVPAHASARADALPGDASVRQGDGHRQQHSCSAEET